MADSYGFGSYVRNAVDARLLAKNAVETTSNVAEKVVNEAKAYSVSIADHVKKISKAWKENGVDFSGYVKGIDTEEGLEAAKTVLLQGVATSYLSLLGGKSD